MRLDGRVRDLNIIKLGNQTLVIACDSAGAIGPKAGDRLAVSGELLGRMIAAVPLMEVLASGAVPIALVNTLSVEMQPTGRKIIQGIEEAVREAGLPLSIVNGSTEENMLTNQTGMGVTVVGLANGEHIRLGASKPGDTVFVVGIPMVGEEVLHQPGTAAGITAVKYLLEQEGVHEVLPVGSQGIDYELGQLADTAGLTYKLLAQAQQMDLRKSAGPATCLLVSASLPGEHILPQLGLPWQPVAILD